MADINIIIRSPEELSDQLRAFALSFPEAVRTSTWEEMQTILGESIKLCPIEFGRLRASGYTTEPAIGPDGSITAKIGYGTDYAVYVHEILTNYHKPPTQAKFLEVPLLAHAGSMLRNIVSRVNSKIGVSR